MPAMYSFAVLVVVALCVAICWAVRATVIARRCRQSECLWRQMREEPYNV